jgi:transcriptional regulator with XRE-family HTH domain
MLTGAQIRAARALLKWSAQKLAGISELGLSTIQRMENSDSVPSASGKNLEAVQRVLEHAGVEFIEANGGGPGVRLAARSAASKAKR